MKFFLGGRRQCYVVWNLRSAYSRTTKVTDCGMHIALDGYESVKKASQVAIGKAEGLMRCVCMYIGSALLSQYVSVRLSVCPPIILQLSESSESVEADWRRVRGAQCRALSIGP